jgi:hypothetical protein
MFLSIIEQAKEQDEEREIQKDEHIYRTTGKNIAYDENATNPLVPIDGYYLQEQNELTNAQRAKVRRIIERQKELSKARYKKTEQKIEEHKMDFKNATSFLETL